MLHLKTSIAFALVLFATLAFAHELPRKIPRSSCKRSSELACILFPDVTEGPYYFEDLWVRQDITEKSEGVALKLVITVQNTRTCEVASKAAIDLWHCDSIGIYSHYIGPSNGDPEAGIDNSTFLRGIQLTDNNGTATFYTIFPGWYDGRTVHMHVKVHIGGDVIWRSEDETYRYEGGEETFTGQLFFNETITAEVAKLEPYVSHNVRRLTNEQDFIYLRGGYYGLTSVQYVNPSVGIASGLVGHLTIGVEF